jgi:alginate O-acetyltransferase complex protein AlgI
MSNVNAAVIFANLWVLLLVALPAYHFARSSVVREALLICTGLLVIFYLAPRLCIPYLLFWIAVAGLQRLVLATRDDRFATPAMLIGVVATLAPMVAWKWYGAGCEKAFAWSAHRLVEHVYLPLAYIDAHRTITLPVGLSFLTFRALDLLLQTYLYSLDRVSLSRVLAYGLCPFLLPIGPIATIQETDVTRRASSDDFKYGLYRILSGLTKLFIVSTFLENWGGIFRSYDRPGWQIFLALYIFAFYFYFNFAGFSDLAIGTGRLFGMVLPENFRWPLLRRSPQEFWNNWHASLSRFAQRYIFTTAGGMRSRTRPLALLATMMVIAWWHDLTASWTLFGLYHGLGLIVHDIWSRNRPATLEAARESVWYSAASTLMLMTFVVLGFPIISLPFNELGAFYARLLSW